MFRIPKRLRRVHQLLDNELPVHQRAAAETDISADCALSVEHRKALQVRKALRGATSVSLSEEEAAAFRRRLQERIGGMAPLRSPFSLLLSLWDAVSFPVWRPVLVAGMVAAVAILLPVSRLLLQPEIRLESTVSAAIETDIPDARVLILSGAGDGSDRVWIMAGDTS